MAADKNGLRFDGQVVLVTGGGAGLGAGYARQFATRGARVVVNDRGLATDGGGTGDPSRADQLVAEIVATGGEAVADTHDVVSDPGGVVAAALDRWGRLDALVCNAGFFRPGTLADQDPDEYAKVLNVHLQGALGPVRAAWPALARNRGRIVLTSSGTIFGMPVSSAYGAGKGGLVGLTRTLAADGRDDGVRVNAVLPIAYTRLAASGIPDKEFLAFLEDKFPPSAVAPFVTLLAHDSVPVSGEMFTVGGGRAARVALSVAPGYVSPEQTPEDFLAHFDSVRDLTNSYAPESSGDEVNWITKNLGVEFVPSDVLR